MNVLNANATKRDAKQYLLRFKDSRSKAVSQAGIPARNTGNSNPLERVGINLGGLYDSTRSIAESPQFSRQDTRTEAEPLVSQQQMHVALVCLRSPQDIDDATLDGVALTLSQLVQLDMRIVIVLDTNASAASGQTAPIAAASRVATEQAQRLNVCLSRHSAAGARLLHGTIGADGTTQKRNGFVELPKMILDPLRRSVIPIIPALGYTRSGFKVALSAPKVMTALTQTLSGIMRDLRSEMGGEGPTSLDRIIMLDSLGGIPSKAREGAAHVFINLEQEFKDIQRELNAFEQTSPAATNYERSAGPYEQHRINLRTLQACLSMLPSASSALIITPEEAASSSRKTDNEDSVIGAGTRRQKNILIHNLLTNRAAVSSSLPAARMQLSKAFDDDKPALPVRPNSTLVKRGMPVTIIPDTRQGRGWQLPQTGSTVLDLETDPRIDLSRLVYLIEDSFRRNLNVRHYLDRIRNRTAGIIIAGSYEGGAILTWEQPPGTSDPSRLVPYLDKFAVLASSQGSSGVADILFQSMVRTCFPDGVCWRSRKDNPVNKWYFERADGHYQIPDTNWTMFWTGKGIVEDQKRWEDYLGVCSSVGASWADVKKVMD